MSFPTFGDFFRKIGLNNLEDKISPNIPAATGGGMVCLYRKEKIKTTCEQNYLLSNASRKKKSSVSFFRLVYAST